MARWAESFRRPSDRVTIVLVLHEFDAPGEPIVVEPNLEIGELREDEIAAALHFGGGLRSLEVDERIVGKTFGIRSSFETQLFIDQIRKQRQTRSSGCARRPKAVPASVASSAALQGWASHHVRRLPVRDVPTYGRRGNHGRTRTDVRMAFGTAIRPYLGRVARVSRFLEEVQQGADEQGDRERAPTIWVCCGKSFTRGRDRRSHDRRRVALPQRDVQT